MSVMMRNSKNQTMTDLKYKHKIVWRNVLIFIYIHLAALHGVYLIFSSAKVLTTLWAWALYMLGSLGITAGAHRLWSHRTYKAKWPLRLFLALCDTIAYQNDIYDWSRDHRVHHKFSDTDADPYNASRGFFFCHIGWLLVRKHPLVIEKGKQLDLSDLRADPIVMYQRRYYMILMPLIAFILPTMVPVYFWNETWFNSWIVSAMFRYCFALHMTWLVNSAAHFWGYKPYDVSIKPAENIWVSLGALGEGWHNYHHVFPWDYKAAELGKYSGNMTTAFIDLMAKLGLAYDLKTASKDMVMRHAQKRGDGSHPETNIWGWKDLDMTQDDKKQALVLNGKSCFIPN